MRALTCGLSRWPAALFGQQAQAAAVSRCFNAKGRAASRTGGARCAVRHLHARHACRGAGWAGCLLGQVGAPRWLARHHTHNSPHQSHPASLPASARQLSSSRIQGIGSPPSPPRGVQRRPEQHSASSRHDAPSSPRPASPAAEQPAWYGGRGGAKAEGATSGPPGANSTACQTARGTACAAQRDVLGLHAGAARLPLSLLNRLPAAVPALTRVRASAEAQLLCRVAPEGTRATGVRVHHSPLSASGIC